MEPFFIIGNPRSGTTLFRLMLNSHSRITVPPECGFLTWLYPKYGSKNFLESTILESFIDDLLVTKKFETWRISKARLIKHFDELRVSDYGEAAAQIYYAYSSLGDKKSLLIGDKNNYYVKELEIIKRIYPRCRFLFIVRDGRDVAASYREVMFSNIKDEYAPLLPVSIDAIAQEWVSNNQLIIKELKSIKMHFLIRYEDLISEPKLVLKEVCKYLKIPYEEEMMNFYLHNDEPVDFLKWKKKITTKLDNKSIGRFRHDLSGMEISQFESTANDLLAYFRYKPASDSF